MIPQFSIYIHTSIILKSTNPEYNTIAGISFFSLSLNRLRKSINRKEKIKKKANNTTNTSDQRDFTIVFISASSPPYTHLFIGEERVWVYLSLCLLDIIWERGHCGERQCVVKVSKNSLRDRDTHAPDEGSTASGGVTGVSS